MKAIITILLSLFALSGMAQRVYSPSADGVPGRNQPVGLSGLPLDSRSKYHDTTISPAKWRDFQSVSEVNIYFNTSTKRDGRFPIYIHSGGTLSAGVWTGGTFSEYWYIGPNDADLIVKGSPSIAQIQAASNSDLIAAIAARFFGDSLTYGTGGNQTTEFPGGTPFMSHLQALTGWNFFNYGVPGETSTQVKTRLIADSANKAIPAVIWAGTNNLGSIATIQSDIIAMVAALGHTRYLIIDLLGQNNSTYWSGTASNTAIRNFNTWLETTFPGHIIHLRGLLIDAYDAAIPADTLAYFHNVWPPSYGADETHLNEKGYRFLASQMVNYMDTLLPKPSEAKVMTTSNLKYLLGHPGVIGNVTPSPIAAKTLGIAGGTLQGAVLIDGGGYSNKQVITSNGGGDFLYPGGANGFRIKPHYANLGGYSTLELSGTSSAWPFGKGLVFRNDAALVSLGTDFTLNGVFTHNGNSTITGTTQHLGGGFYTTTLGVGSYFSALRPIDFSPAGNGMLLPFVYSSQHTSKMTNGNTYEGELYYNPSAGRAYVALSNGSGYGRPTGIATMNDLDLIGKMASGAGIGVSGTGSTADPYIPRLLSLATPGLLTGTTFGTIPDAGSPTNTYDKAHDSAAGTRNISTAWRGAATNGANANGIGVSTATVLTKLIFYPDAGLASYWNGAKIQGSNTSSTTGYEDLYTFSTAPPDFQYSTVNLAGTTAYKYFRVYAPSSRLDAADLQFYGYIDSSASYPRLALSTDASKIIITRANGTKDSVSAGGGGSTDTTSLSTRINNAFNNITFASDSSSFTLVKPNGLNKIVSFGASGGSGGTGTATDTTSLSNRINLKQDIATAATITGTQTLTNKTMSGVSNTFSNIPESAITNLVSDLALKAPLASPALTGNPTAPTQSFGDSTTKLATTAFVDKMSDSLKNFLYTNTTDSIKQVGGGAKIFQSASGNTLTARSLGVGWGDITILYNDVSPNDSLIKFMIGHNPALTPTFAASGLGTGATMLVTGDDNSGVITINTGTGSAANINGTLTFATSWGTAPNIVTGARNLNAAGLNLYSFSVSGSFANIVSTQSLTTSTTYQISYQIHKQ